MTFLSECPKCHEEITVHVPEFAGRLDHDKFIPMKELFLLTKEEVEYLVNNIQHEYLNKDTYYFASNLFKRMEEFLKERKE